MVKPGGGDAVRIGRLGLALGLGTTLLAGCLGAPRLEERWTRVDVDASSPAPYQSVAAGTSQAVTVSATITYRSILTGFVVAELRASDSLAVTDVTLHPDAPRLPMAHDIDRLLQRSVSLGRATRAVTGWDHLVQRVDFTFDAAVPAASGSTMGLFLVCYLAQGDKVERADGTDTLIVTPFQSDGRQVLPVGMELVVR